MKYARFLISCSSVVCGNLSLSSTAISGCAGSALLIFFAVDAIFVLLLENRLHTAVNVRVMDLEVRRHTPRTNAAHKQDYYR
jgi:hypothetical protein